MQKGLCLLIVMGFVSLFFTCQFLEHSDLIGTYKAVYPDKVQILILKEDGTYERLFTTTEGTPLRKYVGRWEFRKNYWDTDILRHALILHGGIFIKYDGGKPDTTVNTSKDFLQPMSPLFSPKRVYFEIDADASIYLRKQKKPE